MEKIDQLRLLATFHYVLAAIAVLFSMFPLIHVGFGVAMLRGALDQGKNGPPPFVGWLLIGIGSLFIAAGVTYAILVVLAARYLSERRVDVLIAAVSREHLERHLAPLARLDLIADIVDAANTYAVFVWGPERVKVEYVEHKPSFSLT